MIPNTIDRVPANTSPRSNARIQQQMRENIAQVGSAGPEAIQRRLDELKREWDIERVLEANASVLMLVGLGLGAFHHLAWLALPVLVAAFLLWHAIQGWCPPVPLFRWMGIRTQAEIDQERYALKALRGDFKDIEAIAQETEEQAGRAIHAVTS